MGLTSTPAALVLQPTFPTASSLGGIWGLMSKGFPFSGLDIGLEHDDFVRQRMANANVVVKRNMVGKNDCMRKELSVLYIHLQCIEPHFASQLHRFTLC